MPHIPPRPMTLAEQHVDWDAHQNHILRQRLQVEQACQGQAVRLAKQVVILNGAQPKPGTDRLASLIERALTQTLRFGYHEAQKEIVSQRALVTEYQLPDAGEYYLAARYGLGTAAEFVTRRAQRAAQLVAHAISTTLLPLAADTQAQRIVQATGTAKRQLHNLVLELVGETLNLGRAAGALNLAKPPTFALRSEQLDTNTCEICDRLHGEIVQVGTAEFFADMPPTGCLGGGRCRGIYVFGDNMAAVAQPKAA